MEQLEPCPFCGGRVYILEKTCMTNGAKSYDISHPMLSNCIWRGTATNMCFESPDAAIEAWNRRVCR